MKSRAKTPDQDVKSLPADRRDAIRAVRGVILENLPKGYEETAGEAISTVPVDAFVGLYEKSRRRKA
ncbi:MAG TPA: hypothetical protein VE981_15695 [Planctomycetota bacterium]|nr:hypothetical protein [Planctomycetota bacterium]